MNVSDAIIGIVTIHSSQTKYKCCIHCSMSVGEIEIKTFFVY